MPRRPIEYTLDQLHRQKLDRLILEIYGYIIPTEDIVASRKEVKRKQAPAPAWRRHARGRKS